MQAGQGNANQGGRGKRGIMAEVAAWHQEGQTEKDIRDKLKARNYQGPRITELLKITKASVTAFGAMPTPPPAGASSHAPPVQAQKSDASSRAPCQSYGKMRRERDRPPNPF